MKMLEKYISPILKTLIFSGLIYIFGFTYGAVFYCILYFIQIKIIERLYGIEYLPNEDTVFKYEYNKSPNVVISSLVLEKLPLENFKTLFKERVLKRFIRTNQSIIYKFFDFYYVTHDMETSIKNIKPLKINFKSGQSQQDKETAIKKFAEKKFASHLKFNKPLWRIYYCENYEEDKSLAVVKFHHCIVDGSAMLNLFSALSDNQIIKENYNDVSNNKYFKKLKIFDQILLILFSPIAGFLIMPAIPTLGFVNPFRKQFAMSTENHTLGKSCDMSVSLIKKKISEYKKIHYFSINDFLVFLINKSLKNYHDYINQKCSEENNTKKGSLEKDSQESHSPSNNNAQTIIGVITVSYRFEFKEGELGNYSAGRTLEYDFNYSSETNNSNDDFNQIIKISKKNEKIKNKFTTASAMTFFTYFFSLLMHESLSLKIGEYFMKNFTYIFSNIRGIDTTTDIGGKTVYDVTSYIPHGVFTFSFVAINYNGKMNLTVHSDKACGTDVDMLMSYFNKNYQDFISA